MSEPHDHSQSGFDAPPPGGSRPGPPPPPGADRFWRQYSSARPGRGEREDEGNGAPPPGDEHSASDHECLEWCPICRSADVVRATTPPELRDQWQALQRDALMVMRGLIDAYLTRMGEEERNGGGQPDAERVQSIRIE